MLTLEKVKVTDIVNIKDQRLPTSLVIEVLPNVMPPSPLSLLLVRTMKVTKGAVVGDFGCGCGVLAITAAKLGAERVYAIDANPHAVKNTMINAGINNVDAQVIPLQGDIVEVEQIIREPLDIIVANPPQLPVSEEGAEENRTWMQKAYDAGRSGRKFVDIFISKASKLLNRHFERMGMLEMVTTSVVGIEETYQRLSDHGFTISVLATEHRPFREVYTERLHLIPPGYYYTMDKIPYETIYVLQSVLKSPKRDDE